jgi:short-subunit dehydrogenase
MKILLTWTTSWIWNFVAKHLLDNHKIIWVWRSENNIEHIDFFRWDIRDENFLNEIVKNIDEIDFLILNSWVWYFDSFEKIDIENHIEIIETNLLSPILLSNLLLRDKKIKKWIIFIWSIAWKKSMKNWASYSASKFWLRGFAMQLKNEYTKLKIHLVNPSVVKTNFHLKSGVEIVWKYRENTPDDVFEVVNNIINWNEHRFEIDL